jgi:hypothetical protein
VAKISKVLEERLRSCAPDEQVELVLELGERHPDNLPTARSERNAALEEDFKTSTEPLKQLVRSVGGEVLKSTWLASALKVRIPAEGIERLRSAENVEFIDLPRQIKRG